MGNNTEKSVVSVGEAGTKLGIGRSLAYTLAREGKLPGVLHLGRRMVVSKKILDAVLAGEIKFTKDE